MRLITEILDTEFRWMAEQIDEKSSLWNIARTITPYHWRFLDGSHLKVENGLIWFSESINSNWKPL